MAFVDKEYLTNQFKAFLSKCNEVFAKKSEIPVVPPVPHIPTKLSELENDEGYIKEVAIATLQQAGIVKPDGTTIDIDADGTIKVIGGSGGGGGTGTAYTPKIGTVTVESQGNPPSVSITLDEQALTAAYNFVLPKGKDGRSITGIETDGNNNVIVTFSDSTKQSIGQIKFDISADFLTDGGFGNIRYYQSRFQVFNKDANEWVDATVDPQNPYILQMIPQEMQSISAIYDRDKNKIKLKWSEARDTIIEEQTAVVVEKVVIRRKQGSVPKSISDGDDVITVSRSQFGLHKDTYFIDNVQPKMDEVWYYKAFPVSTSGFVNESEKNQTKVLVKDYVLFGFKIDQTESDPLYMINYLSNCDNINFKPAYMDYDKGKFDYGDWTTTSAWFMNVKPCLLKRDGTVLKYINPDNYYLDIEGNDVTDYIINGTEDVNVMIEVPKVYWKIVPSEDGESAEIYFSDKNIKYENGVFKNNGDGNFACWSHIDEGGNEIPYCYMPAYNGSYIDGVLRSLSDKTPANSYATSVEIDGALANNVSSNIWYTEVYCDRVLINLLLLLIGKSTDTQKIFGYGYASGGNSANTLAKTGLLSKNGMFYGTKKSDKNGVKVFGMEHYWGNLCRRTAGWINDSGEQKIKMTYSTLDGSEEGGYNENGQGYIVVPGYNPPDVNDGSFITKMLFCEYGLLPLYAAGSDSTYYTDGFWVNNNQSNYVLFGGESNIGAKCGAFASGLHNNPNVSYWTIGASISCKPLASTWEV